MIPDGYQLIEPLSLGRFPCSMRSGSIVVAVLSWLIELIRVELGERLGPAKIELIQGEYFGIYPAIGIKYATEEPEDLEPLVEEIVARLLKEKTMSDFIDYLMRTDCDWARVAKNFFGPL
jgi:hypothetical protein